MFQTLINLSDADQAEAGPAVGPLVPKDNLVSGQHHPQVVVHRRVVEGHRQDVVNGHAVAADQIGVVCGPIIASMASLDSQSLFP